MGETHKPIRSWIPTGFSKQSISLDGYCWSQALWRCFQILFRLCCVSSGHLVICARIFKKVFTLRSWLNSIQHLRNSKTIKPTNQPTNQPNQSTSQTNHELSSPPFWHLTTFVCFGSFFRTCGQHFLQQMKCSTSHLRLSIVAFQKVWWKTRRLQGVRGCIDEDSV